MTQPSPHKWTIPQINFLQSSWAKGTPLQTICQELSLSKHIVWRMRKKLSLPYRNQRPNRKNDRNFRPDPVIIQLRLLRESKNLSRMALAAHLGYDHCTLGDWERGRYSPRLVQLQTWAEA